MNCSMPGFPILHYLPEFAQMHIHWVHDTIQPSHPLSLPSASALNLSQNQALFQLVGSSLQVARVLELQLQHQFFQWILRVNFLEDWLVWSLCCLRDSQASSQAPQVKASILWCSAFFTVQLLHHYLLKKQVLLDKPWLGLYMDLCW